jgi:hypothetical protein
VSVRLLEGDKVKTPTLAKLLTSANSKLSTPPPPAGTFKVASRLQQKKLLHTLLLSDSDSHREMVSFEIPLKFGGGFAQDSAHLPVRSARAHALQRRSRTRPMSVYACAWLTDTAIRPSQFIAKRAPIE